MAFGGKVHHGARAVFGQQPVDQRAIADLSVHEHMPRIAPQPVEVVQVARVGERVEVDHRLAAAREPIQDEIAADEAGAAGDENHSQPF